MIDDEIAAELAGTPEESEYRRRLDGEFKRRWPKPTKEDVLEEHTRLQEDAQESWESIREHREMRFGKDVTPEALQRRLIGGTKGTERIRSRLSHNEIMRVTALASRNPPKFHIPVASGDPKDAKRAQAQERWCNNLWPMLERIARQPLRRLVLDHSGGDGYVGVEIYRTKNYDHIGTALTPGESGAAHKKRLEREYAQAGSPYCVRIVDPMALLWDYDDEGTYIAIVAERRPLAPVRKALKAKMTDDEFAHWKATRGGYGATGLMEAGSEVAHMGDVEILRYYDRRWYVEIVDGAMIGEPVEHAFGFVPMVIYEGLPVATPNRSQRYQGVTWHMIDLERALNDLLTLEYDNAIALAKPKLAITQHMDARAIDMLGGGDAPPVDFTNPDIVPRLRPGEMPVNLTETFAAHPTDRLRNELKVLWQMSGLNPIAQGESPGSDPAGYTVNTLTASAQSPYEAWLDNVARGDQQLADMFRMLVRDDLRQPWYNAIHSARIGERPTLAALRPDDVDDIPCEVTIDSLADVNRIAMQQSLRQANAEGYIARRRVQVKGFGVEDPELENEEIIEDKMEAELVLLAIEEAKAEVFATSALAAQQQMQTTGPGGQPLPATQGAQPAPLNPPAVGPTGGGGGPALEPQTASAGQGRGYAPPGVGV